MNHTQTLLRMELPKGVRVWPSQLRELLAKQPGADLPNALFHRDADGGTINDRPDIRVAGGRTWVGMVADPGSENLLAAAVGQAISALNGFTGMPCRVEIEHPQFALTQTHEPHNYYIREMALKRRSPKSRAASLEELIAQRLASSLEAVCVKYGFDCPPIEQLSPHVVEVIRPRGLRLQTCSGTTNEYVTLVDAIVCLNAELKGYWFVGNLTSRGYGRVIKERPGLRFDASLPREVLQ